MGVPGEWCETQANTTCIVANAGVVVIIAVHTSIHMVRCFVQGRVLLPCSSSTSCRHRIIPNNRLLLTLFDTWIRIFSFWFSRFSALSSVVVVVVVVVVAVAVAFAVDVAIAVLPAPPWSQNALGTLSKSRC